MDRRSDIMRHFPTLIGRWKGAHARLWNLTQSHTSLTILLTKDDTPGCLQISCISPARIEAPIQWNNSDIQVEMDTNMFRVVDVHANVQISECGVEVTELDKKPQEKH